MNDHDIENLLRAAETRRLDPHALERIQAALRNPHAQHRAVVAVLTRPVPLWRLIAASVIAAGVGAGGTFWLHTPPRPGAIVASPDPTAGQPQIVVVRVPRSAIFGGSHPLAIARWSAGSQ